MTGLERAGCEAWASGGKEAELQAKQMHWQREKEEGGEGEGGLGGLGGWARDDAWLEEMDFSVDVSF